jgi:hypothetical protein
VVRHHYPLAVDHPGSIKRDREARLSIVLDPSGPGENEIRINLANCELHWRAATDENSVPEVIRALGASGCNQNRLDTAGQISSYAPGVPARERTPSTIFPKSSSSFKSEDFCT